MLFGFIGRVSSANQLKDALDVSSQRTRAIADRVSKATLKGTDGFALPRDPAQPVNPETAPVNVEEEMTSLADEQLRFEATAKLLQKTYEQIRTSFRDRA
jgi:flagellar basal body rod protein FlgB